MEGVEVEAGKLEGGEVDVEARVRRGGIGRARREGGGWSGGAGSGDRGGEGGVEWALGVGMEGVRVGE